VNTFKTFTDLVESLDPFVKKVVLKKLKDEFFNGLYSEKARVLDFLESLEKTKEFVSIKDLKIFVEDWEE
jgi:hypothetical protein